MLRNDNDGIPLAQLLFMQELGLIDAKDTLSLTYNNAAYATHKRHVVFERNGIGLVFSSQQPKVEFEVYKFTSIGREFLLLNQDVEVDTNYLKKIAQLIHDKQKTKGDVKCGKINIPIPGQWEMKESDILFEL